MSVYLHCPLDNFTQTVAPSPFLMLTNFSSSFTTQQFGEKMDKKHFPEKHSCEDESNRIPVLGWHWLQPSNWDLTIFPMFFWFPGVVHMKTNIHLAEVNMNAYMLQDSQTCPTHWTSVKEQRQDRACVCPEPTNTGRGPWLEASCTGKTSRLFLHC